MTEAVIFDMYGVIMRDPDGCLAKWIRRQRPRLSEDEVIRVWFKLHRRLIGTAQFWTELGFTGDLQKTETEYLDTLEIDEGFYAAADALKKNYRLALLSNDASEWSAHLRRRFGLDRYFDAAVISGDHPVQKPDPALYRILLERLGLPPERCAFIDDRKKNLDAARSLGITPILFRRPELETAGYEGLEIRSFAELEATVGNL